jgi:DNA (cytosine-5)-methyltransferase 1
VNLYTDHQPEVVAWLGRLISAEAIAPGVAETADIRSITGADTDGFNRVHLFAGIGGWEEACRLADWPADLPIWTGSCPCQPFSAAGRRRGTADARHLWPEMCRLIAERRPAIVAGEQVASPDGRAWLAVVRADLEALGYAVGAADLCAAGIGAPHPRQRLYWIADRLADGACPRQPNAGRTETDSRTISFRRGEVGGLVYPDRHGFSPERKAPAPAGQGNPTDATGCAVRPAADHAGWGAADWLYCRDHNFRPVEPGSFPMAYGIPRNLGRLRAVFARLGFGAGVAHKLLRQPSTHLARAGKNRVIRLRGYGNAIVPQVAAAFLSAYLDARGLRS